MDGQTCQISLFLQVNLFQTHLFLIQLGHNMTKVCSWNYRENYKLRTLAEHVHGNSMNNQLSYCGLIDAKIIASDKGLAVHDAILNIFLLLPNSRY